jgi:hypothetical protein
MRSKLDALMVIHKNRFTWVWFIGLLIHQTGMFTDKNITIMVDYRWSSKATPCSSLGVSATCHRQHCVRSLSIPMTLRAHERCHLPPNGGRSPAKNPNLPPCKHSISRQALGACFCLRDDPKSAYFLCFLLNLPWEPMNERFLVRLISFECWISDLVVLVEWKHL